MNSSSGTSQSCWSIPHAFSPHPKLDHTPEVEACVIGAGIAGLTTAYLLLKAGKSVIVLERNRILGGDTGRTTAHLSPVMDDGLSEIEKWHGLEGARAVWQSHADAIDLIEKIINDEAIECDFARVDGFLFEDSESAGRGRNLEEELKAAKRLGMNVEKLAQLPLPGIAANSVLKFPNQAQFHVTKYLKKMAQVIAKLGGKIYEETPVTEVEWGDPTKDEWSIVKTESRHHVKAKFVVEAANSLVTGSMRTITKLFPYRTFAIAAQIPRGSVPAALFWDTNDPYHYVRTEPGPNDGPDLLIVGGEDHKTGQANDPEKRYKNLERWLRARFPSAQAITHRWSGQVLETPDGIALIGQNPGNPENSFLISGDSGHGITHATLGAMIVSDAILKRKNPYAKLYSPSRLHPKSLGGWMKENANVGRQYLDWISPPDSSTVDEILPGEGKVVRHGLSWVAVYKDAEGKASACSAVCPHLGGIVRWNSGEKTWDCPCHGSRFDRTGRAICTPTIEDLGRARVPR
jgi:glycine/D-amino acid oxidase-like deaminating enzyme/nitrite reductase/ring-hydroxylating ferredoxin subunit